jgi:AraC family transcriptional regulator, regulatory protein of adaptative response / methylated-DNA-[protein]-cysteine methyltransferase
MVSLSVFKGHPQSQSLKISYGIHPSPFGKCLLAVAQGRICQISFPDKWNLSYIQKLLQERYKQAELYRDDAITRPFLTKIFPKTSKKNTAHIRVLLCGTPFQMNVWKALLKISKGSVVSYEDIARKIGKVKAVRAVGNAVGANPIAYLVPCHRVIHKSGKIQGYRWGVTKKRAMLNDEDAY